MKTKGCLKATGITIGIIGVLVIGFILRFPPDPHKNCHRALDAAFDFWMKDNQTNAYPNVEGNGAASLGQIAAYCRGDFSLYGYVPGLTRDDPKELVMLYLKKMTRRTWNGDHSATFFTKKKWFIGGPYYWWNPDFEHGLPEGGQVVDTTEFKRRLQMTLDFLEENKRPYWETVVAEHTAFLKSIEE